MEIKGPLGIWPFPILNTIVAISESRNNDSVQITQVNRDDEGRIISIERVRE